MKPMLAVRCKDVNSLKYPVLVSPKLDGVRAVIINGELLARSLKPIPNFELTQHFQGSIFDGLDGELITGTPTDAGCYCDTVSNVMNRGKEATLVHLWVFDDFTFPEDPFEKRYSSAAERVQRLQEAGYRVCLVPHFECPDVQELLRLEELFLSQGYEGAMVRSYKGPYKYGRSTEKEGWLLKVKRFMDSEATIMGFEELLHNNNEKVENELGHSHRSQISSGLSAGGCLGSLQVKDVLTGVDFSIGSGFSQEQREILWSCRDCLTGKIAKYKYFPTGSKERPRFPTFLGFRDKIELEEEE